MRPGATPVPRRSSGTCAIPALIARRGSPPRSSLPPSRRLPRRGGSHPGDRLRELALPVAGDSGDGEDLARANGEGHALDRLLAAVSLRREVVNLEHDLVTWLARGSDSALELPPHHQGRQRLRGGVGGRDRPDRAPGPENRDPIGHRLHLVQLVRDEDDRPALVRHRPHGREERLGFLRREHGGRLVEDQHARLAVKRLQDLHALLLSQRELPDLRARLDREAVFRRPARRPAARSHADGAGSGAPRPGGRRARRSRPR